MALTDQILSLASTVATEIKLNKTIVINNNNVRKKDLDGLAALSRTAGQSVIDYMDSTETTRDWASLTGALVSSNVQVSGNKLYGTNATNPAAVYYPLSLTVGQKFRIATFFDMVALGGSSSVYIGLDTLSSSSTTNTVGQPDAASVGITTTGSMSPLAGSNLSSQITTPGNTNPWTVTAGRYMVSITGDATSISYNIRHSTDNTKAYTWSFPVSKLTALGKTIGRLLLYCGDTRALSGHSIGPISITVGSAQPVRTKTVAAMKVESVAHRDMAHSAVATTDEWRLQIPANYDPRVPAPLVLYCHQAQSSMATAHRPWAGSPNLEQPMMKALGDAGYIVIAPQDGFVVGNNNSDRYGNQASMDNYLDMYKFVRSNFAVSNVVVYGPSMAGLTATNIIARNTIPNIAACYLVCPSISLSYPYNNGYSTPISTAYGIDGSNPYPVKTAGFDSMLRSGWEFRGVPFRIVSGDSDTVAPRASHAVPFLSKISPFTDEASELVITGGHLVAATFVPSDMMAFFNKYI